jgi:hypothetical protein
MSKFFQAAPCLRVPDNGDPQESRLAKLVGAVWKAIMEEDRDSLEAYWRNSGEGFALTEVVDDWDGCTDEALAQTLDEGCRLVFRRSSFEIMPDEVAMSQVAHELAHAFQFATEWFGPADRKKPLSETEKRDLEAAAEAHAAETEDRWGFDPEARRKWEASHEGEMISIWFRSLIRKADYSI